jgi:hypothetical protein
MADFEHFNTEIPADLLPPQEVNSQETTPAAATTNESGTPPAETVTPPETKPDEFFENFNKRYSAEVKSDDDIKELFSLKGKIGEYETKVKDHDELKTSVEKYKKELEETKSTYMSDLLAKPLLKQAFVASQLQEKHPNLDKDVLAELAMSDIDKMSDIEVIARERKLRVPKASIENLKAVIRKEIGVDSDQTESEWSDLANTELAIKAADARDRVKQLLNGIEMPKVVTKEEREATLAKALDEKKRQAEPFKEIFKKFDVYKNGDFEFAPPEEFKSKLEGIFNGMFLNSNLEINKENLATAEMIKRALFTDEYLPQMLEVKAKQVRAEMQEKVDKELNNDTPPNTATATDQGGVEQNSGVSTYLQSRQDERAKKF